MTNASALYKAQTRWLFHAHIKIKLSAFTDDALFDELYGVMEEVDVRYNSHRNGSLTDSINKRAGAFVECDTTLTQLLARLKELSDDLEGEYDITVMPLLRLWGFYNKSGWKVPAQDAIEAARSHVNYQSVLIDDGKAGIEAGQEITTGSFLKAFAVDTVADRMKACRISDAIVNAGGSTICALNNEAHPYWEIQVNDTETGKPLFLLRLANQCYSTSSNENTYLEIDGKRYGHIISPKSGYPSENRQVGIISTDALTGDVLSTGLFNCTKETFRSKISFLSRKYGVEGFLTDKNGETVFSANFKQYIS